MLGKTINLTFTSSYNRAEKVRAIKAIRILSGLGLKEAKDIVDAENSCTLQVVTSDGPVSWDNSEIVSAERRYTDAVSDLYAAGIYVTEVMSTRNVLLDEVRQLASDALMEKQDDLAIALIEVLARFKA
jgi:hypothetical protein